MGYHKARMLIWCGGQQGFILKGAKQHLNQWLTWSTERQKVGVEKA